MHDSEQLIASIKRYVERPTEAVFERLVSRAFRFQWQRNQPFRSLCESAGVEQVLSWRQIPAIPVSAYRTFELSTDSPQATFRSSGTTSGARSVHHHPYLDLYRGVVNATFQRFCWPHSGVKPPMMALIPDRQRAPESSLSFMVDYVVTQFGASDSVVAFDAHGVDLEQVDRWCRQCSRADRPGLVLTTSFALAEVLDEAAGSRLPAGSVVFETGGFKGRTREIARDELLSAVENQLGVPSSRVVREYGMTELTSQFYTDVLAGGDPELFVGPPWLKAQILDVQTFEEVPTGETGVLAIFDLANIGSALRILTEDLGRQENGGFRLLGRAEGSPIRGCSLIVEEMAAARHGHS